MPVSGMIRVTPPMMTKVCTPRMSDSPVASSFSKDRSHRMAIRRPVPDHEQEGDQDGGGAEQAELLGDDGEDEVGGRLGDAWLALPRPGPSPKMPPAAMANQPWMIW